MRRMDRAAGAGLHEAAPPGGVLLVMAFGVLGLMAAGPWAVAQEATGRGNEVYVKVGDREVTREEYADYLLEKFGRRALDRFVTQFLVLEEAARRKVAVTDDEKAAWVSKTLRENREDPSFFPWLQSQGLDFDTYRQHILPIEAGMQIALEKMIRADRQTDVGIRGIYEERYGVRYGVRVILVREDAALQEALRGWAHEKIREVRTRFEEGLSFDVLAREYSESADSEVGGDLGFSPRGRLDPALERVIFSLSPTEVQGPVESDYGYHLVQMLERRDDEVRARHILIRNFKELTRDPSWVVEMETRLDPGLKDRILKAAATRAKKVLGDLRLGADFGTVAAQESSHPSARRSGEMAPFGPGAGVLPAPVEEAVAALKPTDLAGPIEGDFGYYIVRLDSLGGDETPLDEVRDVLLEQARKEPISPGEMSRFVRGLREAVEIVTPGG